MDIHNYIRACDTLKETKAPDSILRLPTGQQSVSHSPFQKLCLDILQKSLP